MRMVFFGSIGAMFKLDSIIGLKGSADTDVLK
jgi:hypothetical protein